MPDEFASFKTSLNSPAADAEELTPSDVGKLARSTRAIYVGQGGDLRVRCVGGGTVTLAAAAAGMIYPLRIEKVFATGTSAGGLVALF